MNHVCRDRLYLILSFPRCHEDLHVSSDTGMQQITELSTFSVDSNAVGLNDATAHKTKF